MGGVWNGRVFHHVLQGAGPMERSGRVCAARLLDDGILKCPRSLNVWQPLRCQKRWPFSLRRFWKKNDAFDGELASGFDRYLHTFARYVGIQDSQRVGVRRGWVTLPVTNQFVQPVVNSSIPCVSVCIVQGRRDPFIAIE